MPYKPSPALSGSAMTDSAGGTVNRTILAAGAVYSQSDENRLRSSMADMVASLRTALQGMSGKRGGGYRPTSSVTALTINPTPTGGAITIADSGTVYSQSGENTFRADMATAIESLRADAVSLGFTIGPRATVTHQTDNSGGTPSDTIVSAAVTYTQNTQNNIRASFAAKLNAIATAIGA